MRDDDGDQPPFFPGSPALPSNSQASIDLVVLMKPLETAADGYLATAKNAVPLEKEKTEQLRLTLNHASKLHSGHRNQVWGVGVALFALVAFAAWKEQWPIVSHFGAAIAGLVAGRAGSGQAERLPQKDPIEG